MNRYTDCILIGALVVGCESTQSASASAPAASPPVATALTPCGGDTPDGGADAGPSTRGATLEAFGARCDGTTDDSAALTAAVAAVNAGTYPGIELAGETCLVPGTFSLQRGFVRGLGATSILKTTANATLLRIVGATEAVSVSSLALVGNGAGTSQTGLQIGDQTVAGSGLASGTFHDLYVSGMGGDGIAYAQNPLMANGQMAAPLFSDLEIHDCGNGFDVQRRGEYLSIVGLSSQRNAGWGLIVDAGNVTVTNAHVEQNHNGIWITNGENGSHGCLDNVTSNHNGNIGLEYDGTNGERVNGSAFFQSNVVVGPGARGLLIADSQIDVAALAFGAGSTTELVDCMFGASYGDVVSADATASVRAYHPTMWSDGTVPGFMTAFVAQ